MSVFLCIFATMKVGEAIDLFAAYITSEARLSAGTVRNYLGDLGDFCEYLEQQHVDSLEDVTSREVRSWQIMHMDRQEAPGTVKRRLSSLSNFFRYLRRHDYLHADVMANVTVPKQPRHLPVFFKEKEVERLYEDGLFAPDFAGQRDALMLRMLYETGIRRSEIIGIRESSVDLTAMTIKVRGKRDKDRIVPIELELAHNISRYLALKYQTWGASEWLLVNDKGEQLTANKVYTTVKRYMTLVSNADRISPHVFRHSFATHILDNGGNIQAIKELLGHADLSTTEVYTHVTREHLKEVYQHAHPRSKNKK